jgi:predicted transcriptional regulator
MQQIVRGEKNYEFRRYLIQPSVQRVWFYLTAPFSHVAYICEIDRARTRKEGDDPLIEDGLGNREFNQRHPDWNNYDFAYRVRSVYRLRRPVALQELKSHYGMKGAPRGLVYVPGKLMEDIAWGDQERILSFDDDISASDRSVLPVIVTGKESRKRNRSEAFSDMSKKQVCLVCAYLS